MPDTANPSPPPPPIDVTPPVTTPTCDNVTLRWELPTERVDGSPLDGLSIGTIYVAMVPLADGEWTVQYEVDPYVLSYHVPQDTLPGGVMWFSMTVTDLDGLESAYSNEVEKECEA